VRTVVVGTGVAAVQFVIELADRVFGFVEEVGHDCGFDGIEFESVV